MKLETFKTESKDGLKYDLKKELGRDLKPDEEINMMSDALLLARYCLKQVELLQEEIKKLKP